MKPDRSRPSDLGERIDHRARRKEKARRDKSHPVWFGLGMFGLVGWSVAVPTLLGVMLGLWMDRRWPGDVSWTLTLIIIGVALGCLNAWYWIKQENHRD
ncbi:AtpZ/AtpI family protein [Saccharospirillum salsuginis]|uniref:F0F1 ATP synthase subunit n=1 Tax=Saccharospirillum salsuginis TaxID=418750 RepID=A0A918KFT1_9GAMM|nr:AtpZ/AtpI family protein [Saccharospirillum salsuginis]GGX61867.1 F0F1 ATP synthase subunit [Saccharospirillum salsuginis]